ncbi:unnamed protein product [Spirodela intermedia]|uniref:PRA1 family protein n=1 Tax=Spirodela intermedia TaxID=51605 RepID=A0A7I8JIP3_SPIIN|nr:unnamed protein product [Spirodela intermedia]CAA6670038.1 unnamed protein product [Spirodela intermedia]
MAPPAGGVFSANPLSLSVPEPAFESWLRETGYLEILDERAGGLKGVVNLIRGGALLSVVRTFISILTINPFARLDTEDFSGSTPPWAVGFLTAGGQSSSYSWPAGPSLARMRVQENVKRYARNYASLWLPCPRLYKMPLALFGLVSSLAIWELLRFASDSWVLEQRYPGVRFALVRVAQLATATVLYYCHLQVAVLCALSISYTVMVLHASLRKLSSTSKPLSGASRHKRSHQNT